MSNVSNIHSVTPFIAGKSEPLSGQRLAKIGYKSTKKNAAKFTSVCVSVPMVDMDSVLEESVWNRVSVHFADYLMGVQDNVIRALYEGKNGKLENVSDEDISIESLIAYLDTERAGGRMTKEMIERWFVDNLETNLSTRIAELRAVQEADIEKEVMPIVRGYKGMFSALATGVTVYPEDKVKNLLRALELASEDSPIGKSLETRLSNMLKPREEKVIELMDNL